MRRHQLTAHLLLCAVGDEAASFPMPVMLMPDRGRQAVGLYVRLREGAAAMRTGVVCHVATPPGGRAA